MSHKTNSDPEIKITGIKKTGAQKTGAQKTIWAIVPAAGIGKRMLSAIPKQYLSINNKPVLQATLERLLSVPLVKGVVVALQPNDKYWSSVTLQTTKPVLCVNGGSERYHSVINAMLYLAEQDGFEEEKTWVLVHDAVRPCVSVVDIENLITIATENEAGGLLAVKVRDTMKRQGNEQSVDLTVDRNGLWHALTPQCFAFKTLLLALKQAEQNGFNLTDESSAMEQAGYSPELVAGSDKNIKITRPDDLELAQYYFSLEESK